jgi:hypothetical protein
LFCGENTVKTNAETRPVRLTEPKTNMRDRSNQISEPGTNDSRAPKNGLDALLTPENCVLIGDDFQEISKI